MTAAGCAWALVAIPFGPLVKMVRGPEKLKFDQTLLKKPFELAYQSVNVVLNALGFGKTVQGALNDAGAKTVPTLQGADGKTVRQTLNGVGATLSPTSSKPFHLRTALSTVFDAEVVEQARFALLFAECVANIIALSWCILFLRKGVQMTRDFSTMVFICVLFFGLFRVFPFILIYLVERGLSITFLQTLAGGTRFLLGPDRSFSSIPAIFFLFAESLIYLFTPDGNWWHFCCALVHLLCLAQIYMSLTA